MFGFLQSLIGNNSAKEVKKMRKIVDHINELEPNYVKLSDANLCLLYTSRTHRTRIVYFL